MFSKFYNLKTVKEENDQGFWYGWDITAGNFLSNEDSGLYNTAKGVSQDVNTGVAKVKHESEEDKKKRIRRTKNLFIKGGSTALF